MLEKGPQQRGWRWERTAMIALLLLASGAIVNVAVAWGCAGWLSVVIEPMDESLSPYDREWVTRNGDAVVAEIDVPYLARMSETRNAGLATTLVVLHYGGHGFTPAAHLTRAGWPLKSLFGERIHPTGLNGVGSDLLVDAIDISGASVPDLWRRQLPLRPLWPGFAINTLFYALLLWLLFFAQFTARRVLRRRRGLCEKCAYPIGVGPVCTECGAAVDRRQRVIDQL